MERAVMGQTTTQARPRRTYKLHISKNANGIFKVRPGILVVGVGDTLEWESRGTAVTVMFPTINGVAVVDPNPIYIGIGATESTVVQDITNMRRTMFDDVEVPYSVYCEENSSFAEGGSDPKIIVRP